MSRLLKPRSEMLQDRHISLKDTVVLSEISKAKAKGESPDGMGVRAASNPSTSTNSLAVIAEVSTSIGRWQISLNIHSCTRSTKRRYVKLTHSTLTIYWDSDSSFSERHHKC